MAKKNFPTQRVERRKAQRFETPLEVVYRHKSERKWIKTTCKNISGKGIKLFARQLFKLGDKVEVIIRSKDPNSKSFTTSCKVVWSKEIAKDRFEVGLSFIKIENRNEFIEFICKKMIDLSLTEKDKP